MTLVRRVIRAAADVLPNRMRSWIGRMVRGEAYTPPAGRVRFGDLRRLQPISRRWGKDRGGLPIDRYYVERFLETQANDIRGRVLEVGDDRYTRAFGGSRVHRSDVLHVDPTATNATIVDDLTEGSKIPSEAFDCVILTQVVHFVTDPPAALRTAERVLKPGGVLLLTTPGISQISRWDMERWGDRWRFTTLSVRSLSESVFPPSCVSVEAHGNVLTTVAFLHGLAAQELAASELEAHDPDFEMLITLRAVKPDGV